MSVILEYRGGGTKVKKTEVIEIHYKLPGQVKKTQIIYSRL